ncbi:hypothetical protein F2P81_004201 [Scophthalmus maximus]|uniref:Uncharacterized protein n=1 Tax=Scophthalmus maximus TaxID=52904 RepID=A0A6A4THZ9_SCOMX|nr:hypothetical protein F2P81_004201 [Scophthalmus maximus]
MRGTRCRECDQHTNGRALASRSQDVDLCENWKRVTPSERVSVLNERRLTSSGRNRQYIARKCRNLRVDQVEKTFARWSGTSTVVNKRTDRI